MCIRDSNWSYAQDIPTSTWRGALTLPRELALTKTTRGVRLVQKPVPELDKLRGRHWEWENETIASVNDLLAGVSGETLEIIAEFEAVSYTHLDVYKRQHLPPQDYTPTPPPKIYALPS